MEHILAKDLRDSIIKAAVSGKLTETISSDSDVEIEFTEIIEERNSLIAKKIIKKEKINKCEFDNEIPQNWKCVKLGTIIRLLSGQDLESNRYSNKKIGIPYLTGASNFNNGELIINRFTNSPTSIAEYGDLLLTCKGTVGEMAYLKETKAHIARQIMAIKPLKKVNIEYIKLCLDDLITELNKKAHSLIPGIDRDTVLNCEVLLPSSEEQQRIVDKVNELMAKIDGYEKIENQIVQLKDKFPGDMRDAILQAAIQGKLTKPESNDSSVFDIKIKHENLNELDYDVPEKWSCAKMINISTVATGNSIPEATKKSKYMNIKDGFNYIGTKDVGFNREITYENGVKIPYNEPNFKYSEPGSTLLCIEGGSAGKKIAVTEQKVCYGNKLCSFYTKAINKKYLYYYLQSPQFSNIFVDNLSGMIGGVSINKLKSIILPIPPIEEQQRIVDLLDKVLPLCDSLQS